MSQDKYTDAKVLRRLLMQARPFWAHLMAIFVIGLLGTPLSLLSPVPVKIAVDSVLGNHPLPRYVAPLVPAWAVGAPMRLLSFAACLLLFFAFLSYAHALVMWLLQTYTGERLVLNFRSLLFQHVQRLSLSYHDTQGTADSTYRIQTDAPSIQWFLINGIIPLISAVTSLVAMIWVTARIDWQLALVALTICPILFVLTRCFRGRMRSEWKEVKRMDSSANSVVQEVLSAVRVVKAFGREEHEQQRFTRAANERVRLLLRTSSLQGGYDLLIGVTIAGGTAAALFIGVVHVRTGILTLGELLMVLGYLGQLFDPLKTLSKKLTDVQSYLASAERAFSLLDELPEVSDKPHAKRLDHARGDVEFRDVRFGYARNQLILDGVSLSIRAGSRVGIQGRTGAGKSTLMSLLMRFYDVNGGQILLDGVDLRDYKLGDLRAQYAMVLQDPVLFSNSIAENIAYGRPSATQEDIVKAAKMANAHDFILSLPDGYDTQVGERGMKLSGGERQRISLARAFLKDAPLLILDEPTSSVDVKTEGKIVEAMERLMHGRTTFMIAHRLSTLESCDIRVEMQEGKLVALSQAWTVQG